MNKIIIKKEEIKACKSQARELSEGYDCYYYYKQRDELYNKLIQSKTNRKDVCFDLHGGDLMYDERVANVHPPVAERIDKEAGFTPDEYTSYTGEMLPNIDYDMLVKIDEETGKVHLYEPNGNISVERGAPSFSTEYKHLIKSVWTKCSIEVEII